MRTDTDTLASAMMILSRDIYCEDGVATAAIAEAGCRLLEQRDEIASLRSQSPLTQKELYAIQYLLTAYPYSDEHLRVVEQFVARQRCGS